MTFRMQQCTPSEMTVRKYETKTKVGHASTAADHSTSSAIITSDWTFRGPSKW